MNRQALVELGEVRALPYVFPTAERIDSQIGRSYGWRGPVLPGLAPPVADTDTDVTLTVIGPPSGRSLTDR